MARSRIFLFTNAGIVHSFRLPILVSRGVSDSVVWNFDATL